MLDVRCRISDDPGRGVVLLLCDSPVPELKYPGH